MRQLSPKELKNLLQQQDILLIDVREAWEREAYNIGGMHIPLSEIFSRFAEIPKDKDVVLYCEKGIRSTIAIQRLETIGYHHLINLAGGMKAWQAMQ